MNTFYKPGILEIILHGIWNRHSWFVYHYVDLRNANCAMVECRICYCSKKDYADVPVLAEAGL